MSGNNRLKMLFKAYFIIAMLGVFLHACLRIPVSKFVADDVLDANTCIQPPETFAFKTSTDNNLQHLKHLPSYPWVLESVLPEQINGAFSNLAGSSVTSLTMSH